MSDVTIYYLEMTRPADLNPVGSGNGLSVVEAEIDNHAVNRFLYQHIGGPWQWTDKLGFTDEDWRTYVEDPALRTWLAYYRGSIAGYFELLQADNGDVDIAYFGLGPGFIGRGFGGYFLTEAVRQAWAIPGVQRVTVNTCSLDHPSALANYQARGFRIVDEIRGEPGA
ncbi:acetyltransferase (GNAT) family protein [Tamilnaduibacter salinus]|uniref:Acetyltransferase (GNAT) family protein n=1 Tax=Tamilnaduibacter salinus TaxID=1484056 RepID=A0A2U1CYJ4_9GAMM|nr:GNAT family N-acetyltransferase [Tamilnaduibacter salinus]PVY77549.1 acetyltransferase (GNAT) family protein [Tamilnaduibacter salinus]